MSTEPYRYMMLEISACYHAFFTPHQKTLTFSTDCSSKFIWHQGRTMEFLRVTTTSNKEYPYNVILYNKDKSVCIYRSYLSLFQYTLSKLFLACQRFP